MMKSIKSTIPAIFTIVFLVGASLTGFSQGYTPEYIQGNTFTYTTAGDMSVIPTNGRYVRFTATETTNATSLSVYLNASSTATSLMYGLQADNGSGAPSGVFLASGTATLTPGAWNTIAFEGQSLVAGEAYYLVAQPAIGGNALIRRLVTNGTPNQTYGVRDSQYEWKWTTGGAPSSSDAINFVVGTTSSKGMGFAYTRSTVSSPLSSSAPIAQRFQFAATEPDYTVLDSVTLRLSTGLNNLRDVEVAVLDDSNSVISTAILSSDMLTPDSTSNYTVSFEDNVLLNDGDYYKIALITTEAGANTVRWVYHDTGSTDGIINSATFQGLDGYALTYSNIDYSGDPSIYYSRDYNFSYTMTAIPEPGATALVIITALAITGMKLRRRHD